MAVGREGGTLEGAGDGVVELPGRGNSERVRECGKGGIRVRAPRLGMAIGFEPGRWWCAVTPRTVLLTGEGGRQQKANQDAPYRILARHQSAFGRPGAPLSRRSTGFFWCALIAACEFVRGRFAEVLDRNRHYKLSSCQCQIFPETKSR